MSWPKGRPRPRKISSEPTIEEIEAQEPIPMATRKEGDPLFIPSDWRKGALLNVRNHGAEYIITLWPEEYSPEREERCLKFTNLGECQNFVSDWYSRQHHDPRAR